jgi:predicted AlkP superfamily phosphohydrolase/phosphomutase
MIKKLIVLGIDGMDRDVVARYRAQLPNLYGLMEKNGHPRLRSVFPADTVPAWSTIYTGLDPSEHGILNFVNAGAKGNGYKPLEFDDSAFKGRAFWDVLNQRGLSCAVVLPMNIKKGWAIDGLMITRPFEGGIGVFPESKTGIYKPRREVLGTEGKFTSEASLPRLRDEFFAKADEEIRLTRLVMERENVDVLFAYFSTVDGIQHDFWRHCDPRHPEYPGPNAHENVIRDMYRKMDGYIGEVLAKQPDTPLLIVSDHGHGARPVCTARINELLRRGGYLTPKGGNSARPSASGKLKKAIKKASLRIAKRVGIPKWAMGVAKRFPIWKRLFASGGDFDWARTRAYLSDLSALKNYSYGGIRLNDAIPDKDALADEIIAYLRPVRIEGEDKNLFEWIVRTNTFYHGAHLDKFPEIIYQMDERYGGEWSLGEAVFEKAGFMYTLSPGGHRWRTAVILGNHIDLEAKQYELTDIFGLILSAAEEGIHDEEKDAGVGNAVRRIGRTEDDLDRHGHAQRAV